MWRTVWIHQTVAEGWTVEAFFDEHDVFTHQVYTNLETKHQITMQRKDNGVFQNSDAIPPLQTAAGRPT